MDERDEKLSKEEQLNVLERQMRDKLREGLSRVRDWGSVKRVKNQASVDAVLDEINKDISKHGGKLL